jgi:hypothetical protein
MHAQQAIFQPQKGYSYVLKNNEENTYFEYTGRETLLIMIHRRKTKCQEKLLEKMYNTGP